MLRSQNKMEKDGSIIIIQYEEGQLNLLSMTRRSRKKFDRKIVLVTGASSGIGRQVCLDFSSQGAESVILVARSRSKLEELEKIIREGSTITTAVYPCDVSKKNEVTSMGTEILNRFGHIDILVNNAGFGLYGRVQNQSIDQIESTLFTNYLGTVNCTKVFLDSMIMRKSGHIVNIASVAASFGIAGLAAYCASKYAILGFSESLSCELHGTGVHLTVVSPIGVKTNFFNNNTFGGRVPNYTGFMLEPKKVSNTILRAASSSRFEIIVPFYIRAGVWLKNTFPFIVKPLVGSHFRSELAKVYNGEKVTDDLC
jgi:uncharacterized protein